MTIDLVEIHNALVEQTKRLETIKSELDKEIAYTIALREIIAHELREPGVPHLKEMPS